MPKTIRAKITLLTAALALLILIGYGAFLYASLRQQLFRSADEQLRARAGQLLNLVENNNGQLRFNPGEINALNLRDYETAQLVSLAGVVLDNLGEELIPASSILEIHPGQPTTYNILGEEEPGEAMELETLRLLSFPVTQDGNTVGYLLVGRNMELEQEALGRLLQLLLITGPILIMVAALGGYWLTGQALAPIEKIRQQADSIHAGDLGLRVTFTNSQDEVGRLGQTFNEMLDRLESSFQRQRRFTADASHELRTPLSVIRGEIGVVLDRPRTSEEYVETLQSVDLEAQRMSRLANDLLFLARADGKQLGLQLEAFDLVALLGVLVEQVQPQAQAANVTLQAHLPPQLPVVADKDRLLDLFMNLIQNAIAYAPGARVDLFTKTEGGNIIVSLTDTGPGISAEHLPHIFERFYRVDRARLGSRSGSGLGLAIAQEIAEAHGGRITVQSETGKGTTFRVSLPGKPVAAAAHSV